MPDALRPYEVMIILDADLDEETIRAAVERWLPAHRVERRRARPRRLLGQAPSRLRDQSQGRGLLRGLPGPVGAAGDGRAAPGALPGRRSHPPQGAAHPGEGLRTSEGRRRRGGPCIGRNTWQQTPTPSRSPGTSPAIPRCATRRAASRRSTFGVAVNRSWRNQQTKEWEEQTSFFNVVALASARRERRRVAAEGHRASS